jgi:hypothetical protein
MFYMKLLETAYDSKMRVKAGYVELQCKLK